MSDRPTRLSLLTLDADALWRLLRSSRGQVTTTGDIYELPDLASWNRERIGLAIDWLISTGLLVDDEYGRPQAVEGTAA